MKTKFLLTTATLGLCVLPIRADKKGDAKTSAPPIVKPEVSNLFINDPLVDSPFVIPIPKDESDFTVKPPPGAVIENPALDNSGNPRTVTPRYYLLPPSIQSKPGDIIVNQVDMNSLLATLEKTYKVKIVVCLAPSTFAKNPTISYMRVRGRSAEQSLDQLKVLGLAWRKIGETYFVAWSENDLPSMQNAAPINK